MTDIEKPLVSVIAIGDEKDPKQFSIQIGIHGIANFQDEVDFIMVKMISALMDRVFGHCKSNEERLLKLMALTPVLFETFENIREVAFDDEDPKQL